MTSEQPKSRFSRIHKGGIERVSAFSDGIFAIAITLLILEVHPPELSTSEISELPARLWDLAPKILIYGLSFLVIGVYWMHHHRLFTYIKHSNATFLWLNNIFLMTIAFQPFPTALLGDYPNSQVAVAFYAVCQVVSGLTKLLIWLYASYKHKLIDPDLDVRFIRRYTLENTSGILIFLLSFGIAFLDSDIAKYFWLLLLVDGPIIHLFYPPEPRRGKNQEDSKKTEAALVKEMAIPVTTAMHESALSVVSEPIKQSGPELPEELPK